MDLVSYNTRRLFKFHHKGEEDDEFVAVAYFNIKSINEPLGHFNSGPIIWMIAREGISLTSSRNLPHQCRL
jgi:hypothetical protein